MRSLATGLLLLLVLLLAATMHWEAPYPGLAWVRAFAEAGLVGGLADWFAVVALFRHPLGIPFPHTAILQRNKERVGRELGGFIERHFLTPANLAARLEQVDPLGWASRWCCQPANAQSLVAGVRAAVPEIMAVLDDVSIEHQLSQLARRQIDQLDVAELARGALLALIENDWHQQALDRLIDAVGSWLDVNRAILRERFGSQSRWTPRWIDTYVVDKFIDGVIGLVDEVRAAPRHELRQSFDRFVRGMVERLGDDEQLRDEVERLRHHLLARFEPERFVAAAWQGIRERLIDPNGGLLERWATEGLTRYAGILLADEPLRQRLNASLAHLVEIAVARSGPQVATIITEVVQRWDAREAAQRIELEVGSDLQFIRINGSLVGGAAGLLIHAGAVLAAHMP